MRVCRTQWVQGFSGPTGLNYSSLYPLIDRMNLCGEAWDAVFGDIQTMEDEALSVMAEQRNEKK